MMMSGDVVLKVVSSNHKSRRLLLGALAGAMVPQWLRAQAPTFSTAVNVVNVLANVHDKKGHIIRDLSKDDFVLLEDGRAQTIRYFAPQSDLALILGLMIDSSMSQERVITPERSACFDFLDQVLRPNKDQAFLVQFDTNVMVRQDLTSSWKDLNEALTTVDTPSRSELRQHADGPGTLLYDALLKGAQMMSGQHGRKALIVMTDGVDEGSEASLANTIDAAQKADTLIYSILFTDPGFYGLGGGRQGRGVLERMSRETGGGFFEVSKNQSIVQIFDRIQDELRSQYSLGFVSDQPPTRSEFRKIELRTKQKGLIVQARNRYYARP